MNPSPSFNKFSLHLLQFQMYVQKCSMDMMQCEKIEMVGVPDVCGKLDARGALWTTFVDRFVPPLKCPLRKVFEIRNAQSRSKQTNFVLLIRFQGIYRATCGTFDLSPLAHVPLEPQKVNVNLTLYDHVPSPSNPQKRTKRELLCVGVAVTITYSKRSPKRRN